MPTVSFEKLDKVEVAGGSHAVRIELPRAAFAAHTRQPVPDAEALAKTRLPIPKTHPAAPSGGGSPTEPHKGDGAGQAMAGNGADSRDVRPAFPVFSPRPPVSDRSLLPHSEEKIVVRVDVDALGQVVGENLVKGVGNRLDQIVLDIVKTWRFQPATVDGKPVPTEAELIFPFNQSYPISDT
jgi:protein TonB